MAALRQSTLATRRRPSNADGFATQLFAETSRDYLEVYGAWVHGHRPARHHQVWIDRIRALVEGRSAKRRLLIIAPPGCAKSTWISLLFPPWYLGNHPDHSILFYTSSDTMASQFGGTVKATLEANERHTACFPQSECRPDPGRGWSSDGLYLKGVPSNSKDPSYRAVGYGTSTVGARAHGIILDDPLTQEEAQSPISQERAKRYHDMTVDSRLHPGGWELAIMTAWHENDLRAHLASKTEWDVLLMPALGYWSDNAALWPERFSQEWLEAKRMDIGGPLFNCLYQGDPTSLGGSVFKDGSWFRPLPPDFAEIRKRVRIVQFWDLAFSARTSADYSACVTLGIDRATGNLYVMSVCRRQMTPDETLKAMVDQAQMHRPLVVGIEEAAYRQAITHEIIRQFQRTPGLAIGAVPVKPSTDKVSRALLPAARAEAGMVYADRQAPWFPVFEAECLGFPLTSHDDQVDAFSGAAQLAIEKVPPLNGHEHTYALANNKPSPGGDPLAEYNAQPVSILRRSS